MILSIDLLLPLIMLQKNQVIFPILSDEDISTIALSLQLKAELVTDDFAISNVAKNLSIKVIPVKTSCIKYVIIWKYYCPGC